MKRSSPPDGSRGTTPGFVTVGITPLHAIWSVTQTGFAPAALRIHCVTSPTTLTLLVLLVGMHLRRVRDRIDVDAGDVERGPVGNEVIDGAPRRLHDHERMIGIERIELAVPTGEVRRRHGLSGVKGVVRLIGPFPGAQRRVGAEGLDDPREHPLVRRRWHPGAQVRHVAEPQPALQAVGSGDVESSPLGRNLPVELALLPVAAARANHVHPALRDLLQTGRWRPVRKNDRERRQGHAEA